MQPICSVVCAAPPLSQAADRARKDAGGPPPGRACCGREWSVPSCSDHNGLRGVERWGVIREGFLEALGFNLKGWVECGRVGGGGQSR